jgi:hypothetical protein
LPTRSEHPNPKLPSMALSTSAGPIGTHASFKIKNKTGNYHIYDLKSPSHPEKQLGDVGDLYRDG